jgi:glycerol kinase
MDTLVGLDVGTTGVKALAVTPEGAVLASAEEGYPLSTPQPGWAEQDPEDWWRASEAALSRLGVDAGIRVGLSGQMHGLVCLDEDGHVLRPAILWNDQRTAAECAEIEERVGLERLIALTGYGQESDRRRTQEAGFHHHLVKPVDIEKLEAALKPDFAAAEAESSADLPVPPPAPPA